MTDSVMRLSSVITMMIAAVTMKMPSMPKPSILMVSPKVAVASRFMCVSPLWLFQYDEAEQNAARDDRRDLSRDVCARRVHEQMVLVVFRKPHLMHDA